MGDFDLRSFSIEILTEIIHQSSGSEWFDSVLCQGRLINPRYIPGPDLCHWFLWRLGCRDSRILCRDVLELNIRYISPHQAVEMISKGAQRIAAWKSFILENSPLPGDIISIGSSTRGEPKHICIFLRNHERIWTTVDVVKCNETGRWIIREVIRKLNGSMMVDEIGVTKQLNGWVDISSISYDESPGIL